MTAKKAKKDVAILNSSEMKKLVEDSITDMNHLTRIVENQLDVATDEEARKYVQSIYLRNLKSTDEPVAVAKRLLAEGLTRMELQKQIEPEKELVGKEFTRNVKLTADLLKLVKDMQPREVNHFVQVDDDKMVFDIVDGVYDEK